MHVRVEVKLIVVAMLVPPGNYSFYCSTHPWYDWCSPAKECGVFPLWTCSFFLMLATDDSCPRFHQGRVDRPVVKFRDSYHKPSSVSWNFGGTAQGSESEDKERCFVYVLRDGQLQPTGGPHNSPRTRPVASYIYIYIYRKKGGVNLLENPHLQTERYARSTTEWQDSRS